LELLKLVAKRYHKQIEVVPQEEFVLDRSLDSTRFRERTGYVPPSWPELVDEMYRDYEANRIWYENKQ
jgi:dTDP-4-dehydrorhamnose reductase